jgi:hypothetical protein
MKVTRTARSAVDKPLKGAHVTFGLNEAIPESPADLELLAKSRAATTDGKSELVALDDAPFQGCPVTWSKRRGIESIVMFSYQAVRIINEYELERLAQVQTGCYGFTLGQINGNRLCAGLISKDKKRALLVTSERRTVLEVAYVLFNSILCSDKMPHEISKSDIFRAIANRIPETTELLVVRARTTKKAFDAVAKYAVPYLEEIPENNLTLLT